MRMTAAGMESAVPSNFEADKNLVRRQRLARRPVPELNRPEFSMTGGGPSRTDSDRATVTGGVATVVGHHSPAVLAA